MRVKTGKAVSKILGIWVFFLLLMLKGAFPKAAFASSLTACTRDIRCVQLLKESSTPAVAAPIAHRNDEIGILVIPTGTFIPLYRWSQDTTRLAQFKAKQKYCTTYPSDSVCVPFSGGQCPILYNVWAVVTAGTPPSSQPFGYPNPNYAMRKWGPILDTRVWYYLSEYGAYYVSSWEVLSFGDFRVDAGRTSNPVWRSFGGSSPHSTPSGSDKVFIYEIKPNNPNQPDNCGNPPPSPWKDWPQAKRDAAVALLNNSDWLRFIEAMPLKQIFRPGDTVNDFPTIGIPGQPTDNPSTLGDERQLRTVPAPYELPEYPDFDHDDNPDWSDPDDDNDTYPDTTDPEPQNPSVPTASSSPPSPSPAPSPIPGIDIPFGGIDPAHPPSEAVMDKVRALDICEGTDCSEIAEDLLQAAGQRGQIIEVRPPARQELTLYEYGQVQGGFLYHQVYSDGLYVFDPRVRQEPIPRGEWEEMIRALNPHASFQYVSYP